MSNPVRIALVAEGKTDRIVIEAAVKALLGERRFDLKLLQPEDPASTGPFAIRRPVGWGGVYRWCCESVERAGHLRDDVLKHSYDLVILHVDADVAHSNYAAAHISNAANPGDLPCDQPCPPPNATTDALRRVILGWANEEVTPPFVVLCTPSKCVEAWVLAALYPTDPAVTGEGLECHPSPGVLLQVKPAHERLIRSGRKDAKRYEAKGGDISTAWPVVRQICSEAERFSTELLLAVPN